MSGSIPASAPRWSAAPAPSCAGRTTASSSTWKAPTSTAGWFHSSLLFNLAATGDKPYNTVVTHGFVLDGKGQKMSKSLGNVITPEEIMKTLGADILRLWTASVDYSEDVRISKDILERNADAYRKIRNTLRFLLGALADFDPARDAVPEAAVVAPGSLGLERLPATWRRMCARPTWPSTSSRPPRCLLSLLPAGALRPLLRDHQGPPLLRRPGQSPAAAPAARSATAWPRAWPTLMAPVLSFTADEIWENIPGAEGHVFEQRFPVGGGEAEDAAWGTLWSIKEALNQKLEPMRAAKEIGTSLDTQVAISLNRGAEAPAGVAWASPSRTSWWSPAWSSCPTGARPWRPKASRWR